MPYDLMRMVLALLLMVAAGLKCHQVASSPLGDDLLSSRWVLIATVEFEFLLGLWLLANLWPRLSHGAVLLCFGVFSAISLLKALSGAVSCGCFGQVQVNPWHTLILDVVAVLALLKWRPTSKCASRIAPAPAFHIRAQHVVMTWFAVGVPAALAMSMYDPVSLSDGVIMGPDNVVVLEPDRWLGKPLPLIPFIEETPNRVETIREPLRDRFAEGQWVVLLYRHDCARCRDELRRFEDMTERRLLNPNTPRVVLLEVPPYGDVNDLNVLTEKEWAMGRLCSSRNWFVETPVRIELSNGRIVSVGPDQR